MSWSRPLVSLCERASLTGTLRRLMAGSRGWRRTLPLLLALAVLLWPNQAAALTPEEHFQRGSDALVEGKYEQAIDHLEAYADRGASHPNASYNRGLAYVMRVLAGADRPGDLGRAAAAFEEALLLRPGDAEADHALALVQAEVARRRARGGKDAMTVRPTLDRVIVSLASERTWGIGAVAASFLLSIGLLLRIWGRGPARLGGTVLAPTAAVALVLLTPLYFGARHLRQHTRSGVVVVREAHLADEQGATVGGEPIPEASRLELGERRGRLVHVRWGPTEGWLPMAAVRVLQDR